MSPNFDITVQLVFHNAHIRHPRARAIRLFSAEGGGGGDGAEKIGIKMGGRRTDGRHFANQ